MGPPRLKLQSTLIRKSLVEGMQGNFLLFVECTTTFEPPLSNNIEHAIEGLYAGNKTLREKLAHPKLPSHQVRFVRSDPQFDRCSGQSRPYKGVIETREQKFLDFILLPSRLVGERLPKPVRVALTIGKRGHRLGEAFAPIKHLKVAFEYFERDGLPIVRGKLS